MKRYLASILLILLVLTSVLPTYAASDSSGVAACRPVAT